jgi:FHA domain/FhaA, N-terminal domain
MRPLTRVERFFERLVERPTVRVFGTRVQPLQVLRRIEREREGGRRQDAGRDLAPDRFAVHLSPDDAGNLGPLVKVAEELASGALEFARRHRLLLADRPTVSIQADPLLRRGDIEVLGGFSGGPAGQPSGGAGAGEHDVDGTTRVFAAPLARTPRAALEIGEPGRAPRRVALAGGPSTIGRASSCEITLADAHASRAHARLEVRGGVVVLTDLGSTNGTLVNGHRVREVALGVGDRIEIGRTVLRVVEPDAPTA